MVLLQLLYLDHTMPVGIRFLEDWVVRPFQQEIQILLTVAASSLIMESPNSVDLTCQACKTEKEHRPHLFWQLLSCSSQYIAQLHCALFHLHVPLNLSMSQWWLCMARIYSVRQDHCVGELQYIPSIKITSTSHQSLTFIYGLCILRYQNGAAYWNVCLWFPPNCPAALLSIRWMCMTGTGLQTNCLFSCAPELLCRT